MIKDIDYYRRIDLQKAGEAIAMLGSSRGTHEVFGDAVQSLLLAASDRVVTPEEIQRVLGAPDRIKANELGEVLEYDWMGKHGPDTYASSTPFQFADRICTGLAD